MVRRWVCGVVVVLVYGAVALISVSALGEHMNPDDREVLIDLYNSTNGEGWVHKDNWLDLSRDDWYGITLDEFGYVMRLELANNQLRGNIPASLGDLPLLRQLDLSHNQLDGSIPDSLGNVNFFSELNLSNNQLSGTIPGTLADSVNCYPEIPKPNITLDLSNNQLKGPLPKHLYCIGVQGNVKLGGNQFTSEELTSFQSAVLKAKQEEQERARSQEARFDKSQKRQYEFGVQMFYFGGLLFLLVIGIVVFLFLAQVK